MKRLVWLLLAAILAFGTVGFDEPQSPTVSASTTVLSPPAMPDFEPLALSIPGHNAVCKNIGAVRICATVSDARIAPSSFLTVTGMLKRRGKGEAGKLMTATWHSKGTVTCNAVTDQDGLADCTGFFPGGIKGNRVQVRVTIGKFKVSTFVTVRGDSPLGRQRDDDP